MAAVLMAGCSGSDDPATPDSGPPLADARVDSGSLCGGAVCPADSTCVDNACLCDQGFWPTADALFCVSVDISSGVVAHYPMQGDANDVSGQGNDCTVNGPILAPDRFGNADGAYDFDGIDDFLSCGVGGAWQAFGTSSWTFAAWFNIVGGGDAAQTLLNGIYHRPWITVNNDNHVHLAYMDEAGDYTPSASTQIDAIVPDEWVHVVLVSDGERYTYYVNGEESGYKAWGAIAIAGVDHYRIGNTPNGEENFNGQIDDVMLFDRALSPEEANALWAVTAISD